VTQTTTGKTVGTTDWQKWEQGGAQTALSGSGWNTIFSRTADPLAGGTYLFSWSFEISNVAAAAGTQAQARGQVDDGGGFDTKRNWVHETNETEWSGYSGWDFATYAAGDQPVIRAQLQAVGGSGDVRMRKVKLSYELMPESS
jgi:hypothetical protein